jgi:undecaprenyl-diphosphatase
VDRPRWVSLRLLREAVARLHGGWIALPREARRRWWATLAAGEGAVLLLTAALVSGARALERSGALAWEEGAVRWIEAKAPLSFNLALWLEGPGNGFVLWALVLYAAGVAAWTGRPLRCIALLMGYTLAYAPIALAWWTWDRQRPRIILGGAASPGGVFHAFPSGHVIQAVVAYGLLVWFWARRAPGVAERAFAAFAWLVVVAAVAAGRLRTGAHWPTDIAGGAAIGLAWLVVVVAALHRAERVSHRT